MAGPNVNLPDGTELVTIPVGNDVPWYFFTIGLSGVQYLLTFRFNVRMQRWLMDIADALGVPILSSLPLLLGQSLTGRFKGLAGVPVGDFYVFDDTSPGQGNQPTRYSFGTTHSLWYSDPLAVT
jgi:hypothetical protein